jgi:hypothetical protein
MVRIDVRKVVKRMYIALTDIVHFFTGFIMSFNPLLALSVTILYVTFQLLEYSTGLELRRETIGDLKEYTAGLVIGFIVHRFIGVI